jgi:DNA-directed RNA polymerase subunit alpha
VAYSVEPARVGQRTDFDKLTVEIETNGAIDPRSAVTKAASMLRDELLIFTGDSGEEEEGYAADASRGGEQAAAKGSGFDDTPIEELELGVRSYNCLKREGIETVGDLIAKSEQELMCIPNFGRKSIEEVRERLEKNNLKLKGE